MTCVYIRVSRWFFFILRVILLVIVSTEMPLLFRLMLHHLFLIFEVWLIILLLFNLAGAILLIRWRLIASLLGVFGGHHDRACLSFKKRTAAFFCVSGDYDRRDLGSLSSIKAFIIVIMLREFEDIFFVIIIFIWIKFCCSVCFFKGLSFWVTFFGFTFYRFRLLLNVNYFLATFFFFVRSQIGLGMVCLLLFFVVLTVLIVEFLARLVCYVMLILYNLRLAFSLPFLFIFNEIICPVPNVVVSCLSPCWLLASCAFLLVSVLIFILSFLFLFGPTTTSIDLLRCLSALCESRLHYYLTWLDLTYLSISLNTIIMRRSLN